MLDITHLVNQDWQGNVNLLPGDPGTLRLEQVLLKQPAGTGKFPCTLLGTGEEPKRP